MMSTLDVTCNADIEIRNAQADDVQAIAALYAWHVLNGRASFEEVPPSIDEMQQRMLAYPGAGASLAGGALSR